MKQELMNQVIYQIYTRNFTSSGDFKGIIQKLDYLKNDLKVDIIYLLPISPIGELGRKGDLGSPYSIEDYLKINPELGTLDDFKLLIKETHKKGLKLMIDIVFNHTSRDSVIVKNHPDWMFKGENGEMKNKAGDWSDVYDLDLENDDLVLYLIDCLKYYMSLGVDGFRFDVVSLLSHKFMRKLKELKDKNKDLILLGESVHPDFTSYVRSLNFNSLSDSELYFYGFDCLYNYNNFEFLKEYLEKKDKVKLTLYKQLLSYEESYNPKDSLRIRGFENHDQKRLIEYTKNKRLLRTLACLPIMLKGPLFIYNGLETKSDHTLNLFTRDTMDERVDMPWMLFIKKLIQYKKEEFNKEVLTSTIPQNKGEGLIIKNNLKNGSKVFGLFNLSFGNQAITIKDPSLEDGAYVDYLTDKIFVISSQTIKVKEPLLLVKPEDYIKR